MPGLGAVFQGGRWLVGARLALLGVEEPVAVQGGQDNRIRLTWGSDRRQQQRGRDDLAEEPHE